MIVGILREPDHERRVSMLPEAVSALKDMGVDVLVEKDAGARAFADDNSYSEAGASIKTRQDILSSADLLIGISPLNSAELDSLKDGAALIGVLQPLNDVALVEELQGKKITALSLDNIPRTTRAQAMDVLSAMATISGYKAVLISASHLPKFFPMFMTAAGNITPAKVLILGAGVAGLQAIATARRLGAVVHAFDVRAAAREEVESLGAKFVEVEGAKDDKAAGGYAVEQTEEFRLRQMELIHDFAVKSNVVISTAQIPGRPAPRLLEERTIKEMQAGSVIVDLAASSGGNCAMTENDKTIVCHGVTIIGDSNLPSTMPQDASKMLGKNIINLLKILIKEGNLNLDFEDDIIRETCITHQGEVISERIKQRLNK